MKILVNSRDLSSRKVHFYYGDKIIPVRVEGMRTNPYYITCKEDKEKYYKELEKLKDLADTKLFRDLYTEQNTTEEVTQLSLLKFPYRTMKTFNVYDSIFTGELIYSRKNFHGDLTVKTIPFKDRDLDIKNALLGERISLVLASAIICARDHIEEIEEDGEIKQRLNLYKYYRIPKKKPGEYRDIYEPVDDFKVCMQDLNRVLQAYFNSKQKKQSTNQFAYIQERSIVDNAKVHRDNQTIVKVDIHKFFESIQYSHIQRYLKYLCKDESLLKEFGNYITDPNTGGLYMGNPISGTLANILMYKVSKSLEAIFEKREMSVSIYSDDITVSTNKKISKEMVVDIVNYVFDKFNLDSIRVKPEKTKKLKKQNRRICGVTINSNDELTTKRSDYEMLRVMLHKLSKGDTITIPTTTLIGRINFYRHVDETGKFDKLLNKYESVLNNIGYEVNKQELVMV